MACAWRSGAPFPSTYPGRQRRARGSCSSTVFLTLSLRDRWGKTAVSACACGDVRRDMSMQRARTAMNVPTDVLTEPATNCYKPPSHVFGPGSQASNATGFPGPLVIASPGFVEKRQRAVGLFGCDGLDHSRVNVSLSAAEESMRICDPRKADSAICRFWSSKIGARGGRRRSVPRLRLWDKATGRGMQGRAGLCLPFSAHRGAGMQWRCLHLARPNEVTGFRSRSGDTENPSRWTSSNRIGGVGFHVPTAVTLGTTGILKTMGNAVLQRSHKKTH